MKPSSIPGDLKVNSSQATLFQGWLRNGQCPKGTIPIIGRSQFTRRSWKHSFGSFEST